MLANGHSRNPALDTLRAAAILLVMLFHVHIRLPGFLLSVASLGWMGVDLFFVLSGYLIGSHLLRPLALGRSLDLASFYTRRSWRILPAYVAVLALYVLVPAWRETPNFVGVWKFLTFTFNVTASASDTVGPFSHAWSLCTEEQFYLALPLLLLFLARRPSTRKSVLTAAAIFLASFSLRIVALIHLRHIAPGSGPTPLASSYLRLVYFPSFTHLDGLLAGVLVASIEIFRPVWWQHVIRSSVTLFLASICLLLCSATLFGDRYVSAYGLGACGILFGFPLLSLALACLVASAAAKTGPLAIRVPGATTLAVLAYSLYLTHPAVFHLLEAWLPTRFAQHPMLALPLYFLVSLGAAALLYRLIERPCLHLRDRPRRFLLLPLADPLT